MKNSNFAATQQEYQDHAFYFVTLYTRERKPLFKTYPALRKLTEHRWRTLMDMYTLVQSAEYSMKTNVFHAIVKIRRFQAYEALPLIGEGFLKELTEEAKRLPARVLEHTLDFFRATTTDEWADLIKTDQQKAEPEIPAHESSNFWKADYRVTPINDLEELNELRQYILTNILKGGMYE